MGVLSLSGCGFHLMNSTPLKETYPQLVFSGDDNNAFYKEVLKQLHLRGIDVIQIKPGKSLDAYKNTPQLSCGNINGGSSAMSIGSNAQVLEYTYKVTAGCVLRIPGKKAYTMSNSINRSYLNMAGSTIISDKETETLLIEGAKEMAKDIMFRIQNSYLALEDIKQPVKDTKFEPVKVVFDATSEDEQHIIEINADSDITKLNDKASKEGISASEILAPSIEYDMSIDSFDLFREEKDNQKRNKELMNQE